MRAISDDREIRVTTAMDVQRAPFAIPQGKNLGATAEKLVATRREEKLTNEPPSPRSPSARGSGLLPGHVTRALLCRGARDLVVPPSVAHLGRHPDVSPLTLGGKECDGQNDRTLQFVNGRVYVSPTGWESVADPSGSDSQFAFRMAVTFVRLTTPGESGWTIRRTSIAPAIHPE
jgi:hypothetical protein